MKIVLIGMMILINSCSSSTNSKIVSVVNKNTTLDYEDGLRAKCSKAPINQYRYQTNSNYRTGWSDGIKNC